MRCVILWLAIASSAACSFHLSPEDARADLPASIDLDSGSDPLPERRQVGWVRARSAAAVESQVHRPQILMIHGSPGDWSGYLEYMRRGDLLERADVIAVDRPGYGASNAGLALPDLKAQAASLAPLLRRLAAVGPVLVVGHSYGGPVAVRLAVDYPDAVAGLVLIAASVDPELEEWRWFNRVAEWPPVQWMLPAAWNVSNAEIKPLRADLLLMQPAWSGIRQPVAIVHGGEDTLVPIGNADFAREALRQSVIVRDYLYPDENHFILWERLDLLVPILLECLEWPALRKADAPPTIGL